MAEMMSSGRRVASPRRGVDHSQRIGRIESPLANLRLNCKMIRWKGVGFDQDLVASRSGAVEADHHQMKVDGE